MCKRKHNSLINLYNYMYKIKWQKYACIIIAKRAELGEETSLKCRDKYKPPNRKLTKKQSIVKEIWIDSNHMGKKEPQSH